MGGFLLASAEGCSLWPQQKGGPSGRKDNGFKGVRFPSNHYFKHILEILCFNNGKGDGERFIMHPFEA